MFDNKKEETLYHIFLRVIRLHYYRTHILLEKDGIYPGQPPLLMILNHRDGQSQKELAEKLHITPATLTVMIKRMEKAGLIEKKQDEEDQRITRVYLTSRGREVVIKVNESMKVIEDECFSNFTEEEKILFRRLLMQMRSNLEKVSEKDINN